MNSGHLLGKPAVRPSGREQDMRNFPDLPFLGPYDRNP
jgi:hypothetical protein